MGKVVDFPAQDEPGNGAREALRTYFDRQTFERYARADRDGARLDRADHLLTWLWVEGFRVVPLGPDD